MLELICQQRYRIAGVPVDISPYRNHGTGVDTTAAIGPTPQEGAISFPNPDSRIVVQRGTEGAWGPLQALKIEIVAKINSAASLELVLAQGDGSFLFYINQTALAASISVPGASDTYIRAADSDAPDGQLHPVPTGQWVTLGFFHDGYANMQLLMDGKVVAQKAVTSGVPPVGAGGVTFGNLLAGGMPCLGNIEEIRVWRLDPVSMKNQFLCRPFNRSTAQCWTAIFQALRDWMNNNPVQARLLVDTVISRQARFIRTVLQLPSAEQANVRKILTEYEKLWCVGNIDGPEMRALLDRLITLLLKLGLDPRSTSAEIISQLEPMISALTLSLDCDPKVKRFLDTLKELLPQEVA